MAAMSGVRGIRYVKSRSREAKMQRMKYFIALVFIAAAVLSGSLEAQAQADAAQAHVAAAKAAVSPKTENPQPWHVFNSAFNQMCSEPKPGARPQPTGKDVPFSGDRKSTRLNSRHMSISYAV